MKKLGIFLVTLFVGLYGVFNINTVMAEEDPCKATNVQSLHDNLLKPECSVIPLASNIGATTSDIFEINRSVTIEGAAGLSSFIGQFKITGTDAQTVVNIKNIRISFRLDVQHNNHSHVLVESPVQLTIDNMQVSNAGSTLDELSYRVIDFSGNAESSNLDGSILNINNSNIYGFYEGIRVGGSHVTVNINNSLISGQYGLALGNAEKTFEGNAVNIWGSSLYGESKDHADASLLISGQNGLEVNIGKSKNSNRESILSNTINEGSSGPKLADIIRFFSSADGGADSSNVNINIKDGTKISDNSAIDSTTHFFHFGTNMTNTINLEKGVILTNKSNGDISRKYNTSDAYYVVGVYDDEGNATIKTYEKSSATENVKTQMSEVENAIKALSNPRYRLTGWYTDKETTHPKEETITANVDFYPKKVKLYEVTIDGVKYVVEEGKTFKDIDSDSENNDKTKISEIKSRDNFSRFVKKGTDTTVDDDTSIDEDMELEIKETVKVKIKANGGETEYKVEKGKSLSDLQNFEALKESLKGENKQFTEKFKDEEDKEYTYDSIIDSDLTLNAIYNVNVTINGHVYTLEAGKNLQDLATQDESAKNDIESLKGVTNKKFVGFTIGEEDAIEQNTSVEAKYNVEITINKADGTCDIIEFAEGEKLSEYDDTESKVANAKNKVGRTFSRWVTKENDVEQTFDDEQEVHENTSIYPKFNLQVTVSRQSFDLEEGKTLEDLMKENNNAKTAIEALEKDLDNKHFGRFVNEAKQDETIEKTTPINDNITIKPIYVVKVKIVGAKVTKDIELDENQNLTDYNWTDSNSFDGLKEKDNRTFARFVEDGDVTFDEKTPITTDKTLTVKYNVSVKINENTYNLEEGKNLSGLSSEAKEKLEALKQPAERFARLTDKDGKTVTEEEAINDNIELFAKFNIKVTISGKAYDLEEGKTLKDLADNNSEAKEKLNELKTVPNKHFGRFTDGDGNLIEEEKSLTTDLEIKPVYVVKVKIVGAKVTKDIELDENQNLTDYNWSNSDTFDGLKEKDNRTFARFVEDGDITFDETTSITTDKTLTVKYNVNVRINGNDYTLEEGKTLSDLTSDVKQPNAITDLENIKTAKDNFSRLTDKDGKTIVEDETAINDNIEIFAKFNIKVTISGQSYNLEEGKTLEDLMSENGDAKTAIEAIEKDLDGKHFGRFVNNTNQDETIEKTTSINNDITIKPIYVVRVKIVGAKVTKEIELDENQKLTDYNWDDSNTFDGLKEKDNRSFARFVESGDVTFDESTPITTDKTLTVKYNVNVRINGNDYTLEEGKTLKDLADNNNEAKEKLEALKQPTERFARLTDKDGKTISEEEAINDNIEVFAKFNIKVIINGQEYILEEGKALNDLIKSAKDELAKLKNVEGKTFKNFVSDKNEVIDEEKTNITSDITITPKYTVTLKINGKDYVIDEGQSLKDIGNEALEQIKNPGNKTFKMFTLENGEEITLEEVFNHHTTINVIYNITVTLIDENGDVKTYILLEGDDLSATNEDAKELLNSIVDKNKTFSRFANQYGETVEVNTKFYENTTIKALYKIKVTIDGEEFILEEGHSLDDLTGEDKKRLEALMTPEEGKVFVGFMYDVTDEIIGTNIAFTEDTTLKTVFEDKAIEDEEFENNDNTGNPQTGDYIKNYIAFAIMAIAGIGISIKTAVKNISSKKN